MDGGPFARIWLQNEVSVEYEIVIRYNSYGFVNEQAKWSREGDHEVSIGRDKICQQIQSYSWTL